MATIEQLSAALVKADAAGNGADAKALADAIRQMRAAPAAPAPAAPEPAAPEPSNMESIGQGIGNLAAGAVRGAGSIGATLLAPIDMAKDAIAGKGLSLESNRARRAGIDGGLQSLGAEPDSWMYKGGKLAGEIAGTAGAGGLLAQGVTKTAPAAVTAMPRVAQALEALKSGGMSLGGVASAGIKGRAADAGIRAAGGAVSGAAQAGMIDPNDAGMGAVIGMATPAALQLAGKVGGSVYQAVKSAKPNAGKVLADALGLSEKELSEVIKAANAAPESMVDGSKLTLAQALQTQGANQPSVKMLERIAAGGPGGDVLLKRFVEQGEARMNALTRQGAQTYQGAAATEAENTGNKLAALLRTQAADEGDAVRSAWRGSDGLGGVYGRARDEGVALQFPLDRMKEAMSPLGRGSVVAGADARKVIATAEDIGTDLLPELRPIPKAAGQTQSLEQAVRGQGGIQPGKYLNKEITELGRKQSKTTGLVSQHGRDVEAMADLMHERGFLPDNDPATLLQALRSGGGRRIFADDHVEAGFQRMAESAAGDMPQAERIAKAVPFAEFQRLRRDSGLLAADHSARPKGAVEAGVLTQFQKLLAGRADDAAMGNFLPGENMTPGFMQDYNAARDLTRQVKERYSGDTIAPILRKPAGQNYTLNGNEVTNKLWHGGTGLAGDVSRLKQILSGDNLDPAMNQLRQFIMTDAAAKTTASGSFGAALPKYVESRMPGLQEALTPDQLQALTSVASDIRNAEAAAAVPGLRGSDTQAKITRAMDAGLLDSSVAKSMSKFLSLKGIGAETVRNKLADIVVQHKGKTVSELLSDPRAAALALQDVGFVKNLDGRTLNAISRVVLRSSPALAED